MYARCVQQQTADKAQYKESQCTYLLLQNSTTFPFTHYKIRLKFSQKKINSTSCFMVFTTPLKFCLFTFLCC
eukprot:c20257_g1_i1 orf=37-252(-)